MGTRLTCTHNLCFVAKIRIIGIPLHTPVLLYRSGVQGGIHYTDVFVLSNLCNTESKMYRYIAKLVLNDHLGPSKYMQNGVVMNRYKEVQVYLIQDENVSLSGNKSYKIEYCQL